MKYEYGIFCNITDGKMELAGEKPGQIYFFHYKSQIDWPGNECDDRPSTKL
jgi:hypothetical protein